MPAVSWPRGAVLLGAVGAAVAFLGLPVSWRGFGSWQPRMESLTPVDGRGQSFQLEFDTPIAIEFPVEIGRPSDGHEGILAHVTVLTPPHESFDSHGVLDRARARLRIPLSALHRGVGTEVQVVLSDPSRQVWLWEVEDDAYPLGSWIVDGRDTGGDLAFRVHYRRSVLDLAASGLEVALGAGRLLVVILAAIAAAGLVVSGWIRRIASLDLAALVSAGIGGGFLITASLGWAAAVSRVALSAGIVAVMTTSIALVGAWLWRRPSRPTPKFDLAAALLLLVLIPLALLRLAFAAPLALPPHVDSVVHFATISDLLAPDRLPVGANPVADLLSRYYHLGFHGLAAWLMSLADVRSPYAMLVLGQTIQTAAVAGVYFPTYAATRDWKASLTAVVLAALAWSMPAYASNWAKYPALLGLTAAPLVVGVAILAAAAAGRDMRVLSIVAGLATAAAALIHTRVVVVLAAFLGPTAIVRWVPKMRPLDRRKLLLASVVALAGSLMVSNLLVPASIRVSQAGVASRLLEGPGVVSTLVVLLLAPLAARRFPLATAGALTSLALLLLFSVIPPNPSYPFPLLDPPMLSMVLYLPLAFVGGLGMGSLVSGLDFTEGRRRTLVGGAALAALILGYLAWSLTHQSFSPGECCVLARQDDASLIRAGSSDLPRDARVLIPYVPEAGVGPSASDGGAWILPLTRRQTVLWPVTSDLTDASEHARLCQERITHVYAGGTPESFSRGDLNRAPDFYSPILVTPGAALYAVVGCDPGGGSGSRPSS